MAVDFSIDDLDFFIISEIYKAETTTWKMAKKYFPCPNNLTNGSKNNFFTKKGKLIHDRLKKMEKWDIVISKIESNKKSYHLILDKCHIGKHKFQDGTYNCISLKINNSWVIFQKD